MSSSASSSSGDESNSSRSSSSSSIVSLSRAPSSTIVPYAPFSDVDASSSGGRPGPVSELVHEVDEEFLSSLSGSPSTCSLEGLVDLHLGNVDVLIPETDGRPWRAPEGYFSVYEGHFLCGLTFPLPELLLDYCDKRRVALSQLAPSSVHNMLMLQKLGRECGVDVDLPFFEGVTSLSGVKGDPGRFYVKMKPGLDIITGAPNKIRNWKRRFFFVKKNEASSVDGRRAIRNCWSRDVDRRASKPLTSTQKRQAERIGELSHARFPKILESRAQKKEKRKPRGTRMDAGRDYKFNFLKVLEGIEEVPEGARHDASNEVPSSSEPTDQSPGVDGSVGQPSAGVESVDQRSDQLLSVDGSIEYPSVGEQPVEVVPATAEKKDDPAAPLEKEKKKKKKSSKRQRSSTSSDKERSQSSGRPSHYKDVGFVDDKKACASLLFALKHSDVSTNVPPMDELEEKEEYIQYAHYELKNQARFNKIILDYQRKLNAARQAVKDSERLDELKAEMDKQRTLVARTFEKQQEAKNENDSLKAELAAKTKELAEANSLIEQQSGDLADLGQVANSYQRSLEELKALGEYSHRAKARADRLRERLVYLDKVKDSSKMAVQARAVLDCMNGLKSRVRFSSNTFEQLEADVKHFEAKGNEIPLVDLRDEELAPLGAYVSLSDEFEELLRTEGPPVCDEDVIMGNTSVEEAPEAIQDAAPARPNEEGGSGGQAK